MQLTLASASPRRRELLDLLELPFSVVAVEIVEVPHENEPPAEMVVRLSRAKAQAARVLLAHEGATIIIASDTVVALDGEALGKPQDSIEATRMLLRLRGRWHWVYSGLTLLHSVTGAELSDLAATRVKMRDYSEEEIAAYVAGGDPMDKAGAYAIQHAGFHPVAEIEGSYANVMGLPLCHLARCLCQWGIEPQVEVAPACQMYTRRLCRFHSDILAGQPSGS